MYYDVPTVFFPMIWFEQRATIPEDLATALYFFVMMPVLGLYLSLAIIFLGVVLLGIGVVPRIYVSYHWRLPRVTQR